MKISELSLETIERIKSRRWDRIIEKHEGPFHWESVFNYSNPEFMEIEGRWVLLPVDRKAHQNITLLRTIWSAGGQSVTLFLKDTTYDDDPFFSGFVAVCDRFANEDFFLAILYHEWFVIEQ